MLHVIAGALLLVEFVLSWVLDKTVDLQWLEYLGWATWGFAQVLLFLPMRTLRRKGHVEDGKSYVWTHTVVDTGVYALVRHPQYLGWMIMYLVPLLFNPTWVLVLVAGLGVACIFTFTRKEEQHLLARFGEPYRRYMQRVPRFNLATGTIRLLGRA